MNPIFSALNQGHSPDQILKFLSKAIPGLAQPITRATNQGYSAKNILGFFTKAFDTEDRRGMSESERHAVNRRADSERTKYGLKTAAIAAATPLAASVARGALSRALPASLQTGVPESHMPISQSIHGSGPGNIATLGNTPAQPQLPNVLANPSQPPINTNIVQQQQALPQAEVKTIDPTQILSNTNTLGKVNDLVTTGNTPEAIGAFFRKFQAPVVKQVEKEAGKPFEEVISEYIQKQPETKKEDLGFKEAFKTLEGGTVSNQLYEGIFKALQEGKDTFAGVKDSLLQAAKPAFDAGQIKSVEDLKKFADFWNKSKKNPPPEATPEGAKPEPKSPITPETTQKPMKGAIVETPDGIGEVREIRNGKALVEVDGKMRKLLEEELMNPGLPQKDLADLHEELIEGIRQQTGKEVSRHVEWAGYDPEHKELVYRPWGDKEYVYDNIDPEDVEMLTNLLTQRKTTGENYIGSWEAGTESPIGAAMHALITKVRNKAKESGQEKAHKRRYEAVYSAYEPAQKASKQKKEAEKKRLKDEEKRRKKAEKQALQHSRSPSRVS